MSMPRTPLGLRLRLLDRAVSQVLLWACETRRPTVAQYRAMRALQRRMTRVVYPLPRQSGEN
eukprot:12017793-Alexandrium_andersonii.AAC.1